MIDALTEQVREARAAGSPLVVRGGGTKSFLYAPEGGDAEDINVGDHAGIVDYAPTELVLRARAGTSIAALQEATRDAGQILGFEPPAFGGRATLGGTVAAGFAGARRPWYGAPRDFVLGVGLVTGAGDYVEFGGQVMKNVAGFDVSRLVCGAHGTLGVIADVSLKTLPAPEVEVTLVRACDRHDAHATMLRTSNQALPLSGAAWFDGELRLRFSGAEPAVRAAREQVGGDPVEETPWEALADAGKFQQTSELWCASVAPASADLLDEADVLDWGGARRWLVDPDFDPRARLPAGHATLLKAAASVTTARQQPLSPYLLSLHQRIKRALDPDGIFNRGRLAPGL